MIVYQIQSPINTSVLQALFEHSAPEDTFILMGQACANLPVIPETPIKLCALASDLIQFGVEDSPIIGIDDPQWVALCAEAAQVVAWF